MLLVVEKHFVQIFGLTRLLLLGYMSIYMLDIHYEAYRMQTDKMFSCLSQIEDVIRVLNLPNMS